MSKNKQEKNKDKQNYQDYNSVSLKKLSFGLWWTQNKNKFKNFLIVFLIIISIVTLGYTLFNWIYYFTVWQEKDDKMVEEMANRTTVPWSFLQERSAIDPSVSRVYSIKNKDKYDLYTIIKNNNPKHWGEFSYCFSKGIEEIECQRDFILPNDKKYIFSLAQDINTRSSNINFTLKNLHWNKIDPHKISNWTEFNNQHLDIETKDIKFIPASQSEISEKINLNTLKFKIKNNSPYDYYEMPLNIILFRGNRIVGVNRYILKNFNSNQEKTKSITWPGYIGSVERVQIDPDINILKEDIYSS